MQDVTACCFQIGTRNILNKNALHLTLVLESFIVFCFLLVLGIGLRVLYLPHKCFTTDLTSSALFSLFLMVILPLMIQMMDS